MLGFLRKLSARRQAAIDEQALIVMLAGAVSPPISINDRLEAGVIVVFEGRLGYVWAIQPRALVTVVQMDAGGNWIARVTHRTCVTRPSEQQLVMAGREIRQQYE